MNHKTALITGASSGIGLELARLFAADGYALVLVSRDRKRLAALAAVLRAAHPVSVVVFPADLSDVRTPGRIAGFLKRKKIRLDALVNNAGVGLHGPFLKTDLARELAMIQLNVSSLVALTKLCLPDLLARKGKILNVASTAAFQPGPLMAVYYASKAFVLSFSEALHEELRDSGVTVTTLCPGPTKTGFAAGAGMAKTGLFDSPLVMDATRVAAIGYAALKKAKAVAVAGAWNTLLSESVRFTPRRLVRKIVKRIQSRRKA